MALSTYNDLVSAVESWLHRSDLNDRIPDFIALAETRLAREIRIPDMLSAATVSVPDTGETPLPSNLLELIRVLDSSGAYLDRVPLPDIDEAARRRPTATLYAVRGLTLILRPKPDTGQTTDVTVEYYAEPQKLGPSNQTNLWTRIAPDALLYGALLEAAAFLYDDPRVQVWQARFDRAVAAVQTVYEQRDMTPQFGLRYPPAYGGV